MGVVGFSCFSGFCRDGIACSWNITFVQVFFYCVSLSFFYDVGVK